MIVNFKCPSCNSVLELQPTDIITQDEKNVIQCILCRTFIYFDVKTQWSTGDVPKPKDLNTSEVVK